MTEVESLITLARRYCQEHSHYWAERYSKERTGNDFPYSYTDNDYNLFPRYNTISAIRVAVEMLVEQTFANLENCKDELKKIAFSAQGPLISGQQNDIEKNAIHEERLKFASYIDKLSPADLVDAEPLPYRRMLKEDEKFRVRYDLLEKWNYDGDYWNPLYDKSPQKIVFLKKQYLTGNDIEKITGFIRLISLPRLYEIVEDGNDAEIEFSLFEPDCYETIYTDKNYEWIVYGSHESTITFAGKKLIEFIEQLFSDRPDKLNSWEV